MSTEIKVDRRALQRILKDPKVFGLERRTRAIARSAGPGMESSVVIGRSRARGSVITATFEARHAEARDRALTRALSAGR